MDVLTGRTAVITGAASGHGRAMAQRMAMDGMQLVLADIEADPLAEVAGLLAAAGVVAQHVDSAEAVVRRGGEPLDVLGA